MTKKNLDDFRITRLENEVDFFRKTTEESIQNNGKKIDRILNVLEADDSIGERGLVQEVKFLKREYYRIKGITNVWKILASGLAALLTGIGIYYKNR